MSDLIEERDKRTKRRKKFKKKMDKIYNLAYKDDEKMQLSVNIQKISSGKIRLLDEGAVVGDDTIRFIIKKGTLKKYLNGENEALPNLTDDFVGSVNLGHIDFASFPFIIGEWTKEDLSVVDIGDDRVGLDIEPRLDADSVFVKELQRQPYDIGVSAEFYYHVDWDLTFAVGYLVVDEVYIFAYGLVGECGNVNSDGLELKGDFKMTKEQLEELKAKMEGTPEEAEETAELSEETPVAEESADTTEEETPEADLAEEEGEEEGDGEAELSDDGEEDEGEEGEEEAEEAEVEEASFEDVEAYVSSLQEEIVQLRAENAELKKTKNRLQKKLKAEKEKKESFVSKFKSVAETMGVDETPKEKDKVAEYVFGDGIGE